MARKKSYQQNLDDRTKELEKRGKPKDGGKALEERQLAQNQLQAIQNEQRSNLLAQKTEVDAMAQTNQLVNQAVELGVSGSTAATLGKYGMKTPPRVQSTQKREVKVTPSKITIINNNTTHTTNNTQVSGDNNSNSQKMDNPSKFKTWLSKVHAQQAEFVSKRERDYLRRESSLTRAANKMLKRIEETGKNIAETFSPSSFGQSIGSQLKIYLMIFGMRFLAKYWNKILDKVQWVIDTTNKTLEWFGIGEKGEKNYKAGIGFVPTIIRLLGGDPTSKEDGSVLKAFKNMMISVFDYFSIKLEHMFEKRAEAIKQVKFSWDTKGNKGLVGGILKDSGIENLFSGITTYLGDILTALVDPSSVAKKAAGMSVQSKGAEGSKKHMNKGEWDNVEYGTNRGDMSVFDKKNKHRYGLVRDAVDEWGNLSDRSAAQVSQSLDVVGAIKEAKETGQVDTARFLTGLERLQKKARNKGWVAVDEEFITTFLDTATINSLKATKHIRRTRYKYVKTKQEGRLVDNGWDYIWGGVVPAFVADMAQDDNTIKLVPMDDPRPVYKNQYEIVWEIDEFALRKMANQFGGATEFKTSDEELMKLLQSFIYRKAGGFTATKKRYKGKGSNETFDIDKGFAPAHAFEAWSDNLDEEEDNSDLKRRFNRSGQEFNRIISGTINSGKKAFKSVANVVVGHDGEGLVGYDPKTGRYINAEGYGPPTEKVPVVKDNSSANPGKGVRQYSGGKKLKTPTGDSGYRYNTELAAKKALSLVEYELYDNNGKLNANWHKKKKSATKQLNGGKNCSGYVRRAIAAGLGITDLRKGKTSPPTKAKDYVDYLYKFGFAPTSWDNYSPKKGDIVVFGPVPKYPNGYICIFAGSSWVSDFKQNSMYPDDSFEGEKCATVFRHPRSTSNFSAADVSAGGEFVETGYIDFNGDGKFDAIQTQNGTFKLNEDGSFGEMMSASEVAGMVTASSTFMEYNAGTAVGGGYGGDTGYSGYTLTGMSGYDSPWAKAVYVIKSWFERNVHEYKQCKIFTGLTLLGGVGAYRKDCSGFVGACLVFYGVPVYNPNSAKSYPPASAEYTANGGATEKILLSNGFQKLPFPGFNAVQPFDIMTRNGHIEIYAGNGMSYSWGRCHDLNTPIGKNSTQKGMPSYTAKDNYAYIYRCVGKTANTGNNPLLNVGDSITIEGHDAVAGNPLADFSTSGGTVPYSGYSGGGGGGSYSSSSVGPITMSTGETINQNQAEVANYVMNYLTQVAGLTREQAMGVAGNLMRESSLNPNNENKTSGAFGIGQWLGDRKTKLFQYAKSKGETIPSLATQMEYMVKELQTDEIEAFKAIKASGSINEAAVIWGDRFERFAKRLSDEEREKLISGNYTSFKEFKDPEAAEDFSKRIQYAQAMSGVYGGSEGFNPNSTPSSSEQFELFKPQRELPKYMYEKGKKGRFIGYEKDIDKKIANMTDSEIALHMWNSYPEIKQTYAAYGYDAWKKEVFDKLSRKDKQRYLLEQEGRAAYLSTATELHNTTIGGREYYDELDSIFGDAITPDMRDEFGKLNEKGLAKYGNLYANLSPEQRTELIEKQIYGKIRSEYLDSLHDIDYFKDLDEEKDYKSGSMTGWEALGKEMGTKKEKDPYVTQLYRSLMSGDIENAWALKDYAIDKGSDLYKKLIEDNGGYFEDDYVGGRHHWKDYAKLVELLGKGIGKSGEAGWHGSTTDPRDILMSDLISRTLANEKWNEEQAKINKILENRKTYIDDINSDGTIDGWNSIRKTDENKGKLEDKYNSYSKFLADQYDIFKSKYVQMHLADDFESISDEDSGQVAYEKEKRNEARGKLNQKIADIQFRRDNMDMDIRSRFQNDRKFRDDFIWNYGEGDVAIQSYKESEKGKEEIAALVEELTEAMIEKNKINGKSSLKSNEELRKTMKALNGTSVVGDKEAELMKKYGRRGSEVAEEASNAGLDPTQSRYQYMSGMVNDLLSEVAAGTKSVDQARLILAHQNIGTDLITDQQLTNIKKAGTYDNKGLVRVVEDEKGQIHAYGADGKELQIKDESTGKMRSRTSKEILDMSDKAGMALGSSEAYRKIINGKEAVLKQILGKRYYESTDASGNKIYYDMDGNLVSTPNSTADIVNGAANRANELYNGADTLGYADTLNLPKSGQNLPLLDTDAKEISQATMLIEQHFKELAEKGTWGIGSLRMTEKDKDNIHTEQVNFEGKSIEDLITEIKEKVGEISATTEEELRREYETNPKGSLQVTNITVDGEPAKIITMPGGGQVLERSPKLIEKLYKGDDATAKKLGFSSAAARVYAENQQRDTDAYRLTRTKMEARGLTVTAQIAESTGKTYETLQNLQGYVSAIARKVEAEGIDDGNLSPEEMEKRRKEAEAAAQQGKGGKKP